MDRGRKHIRIFVSRLVGLASASGTAVFCTIVGCPAAEKQAPNTPATQPVKGDIMLTICYANNPGRESLLPAWGFACVVHGLERTIPFDAGANGRTLLADVDILGIEPAQIDVVVLSHVQGDHTGGLWDLIGRESIALGKREDPQTHFGRCDATV